MSVQRQTYVEKCVESVERLERALEAPAPSVSSECIIKNLFQRTRALCAHNHLRVSLKQEDPLITQWHTCVKELYRHVLQAEPSSSDGHSLHQTVTLLQQLNSEIKKDSSFTSKFMKPRVQTLRVPLS